MPEYDKFEELKPLQEIHCRMLSYIDSFCTENNIPWCLARGSALGAARHNGPIPWDDDADIYMMAEDYSRFRAIFMEKGDHEHFYLQELDCAGGMLSMPKLRMNDTCFIEKSFKNYDMHQGIYVDIYLLHNCPATKFKRYKAELSACYVIFKRLSNRHYDREKLVKPLMALMRLFPAKAGFETAYSQMYSGDGQKSDIIADWEMWFGNPRWYFKRDVIFPARRTEYNGYQFCVPNKLHEYLDTYYGNWHEKPPMDKIRMDQHAVIWSINEDFRRYAPNIHDFRDEKL